MKQIYLFVALIVVACCSCKRKDAPSDSSKWNANKKLIFYTYGMPEAPIRENATDAVAAKWGFSYKSVAGCVVDKALTDSVQKHNENVKQALVQKYGKDWNSRFAKEVAAELAAMKNVAALLDKQQLNIQKRAALEKAGDGLHYFIKPINNNLYNVSAEGWLDTKEKPEYVSYFRYMVDLKKATVKLLSDTVSKI